MVGLYLKVGRRQRFPNWRALEAPEELVKIQIHERHPQILIQEVCDAPENLHFQQAPRGHLVFNPALLRWGPA